MSLDSIPNGLREAIESDLQPVRPLHQAWVRTMLTVAILAVVLAFVLAKASLRPDLNQLPMWLSWGCSILQLTLGVLLIGLALREAIPGEGIPRGAVRIAALTALAVQILVGIATSIYSPADHHARKRNHSRNRLFQTRDRHGPPDLRRHALAGFSRTPTAGAHRGSPRRCGGHRGVGRGHSPAVSHVQSLPRPRVAHGRCRPLYGRRLGLWDDLGAPSLAPDILTRTLGGFTVPPDDRRLENTRRRAGGRP